MIDWWNVFTNLLWITGLSVAVGVFSYADWSASRSGHEIRWAIKRTCENPIFALGIALACLGAAFGRQPWWERTLWFLLAATLAYVAGWLLKRKREAPLS